LRVSVLEGMRGRLRNVRDAGVDHVLIALRGACAVVPLLEAIRNKKEVSLANKESLVMAGDVVMAQARKYKVNIIPIDSEQSAIWQCLQGRKRISVKRIF
jgi:1-deoxy-D-xylulose-5-phosphate reductoisomerase